MDTKLWALTSLPWSGLVQLAFRVWCFLVAVVPVKTPLLWKLSFCRLLLGLFRLSCFPVVFTSWTHAWVVVFPLLFGVYMALGLTPQVALWLHSLLSLWAPVLCDCLVAATPPALLNFFPVLLSLQTLNVSIPVISSRSVNHVNICYLILISFQHIISIKNINEVFLPFFFWY